MEKYKLDKLGMPGYTLIVNEDDVVFLGKTGKILTQRIDSFGYKCISVEAIGISKNQRVHKIVAKMCVANPEGYALVMHMDDNKLNCHPSNLRWGTSQQNNWRTNPNAVKYTPKHGKGQNSHAERKDKPEILNAIKSGMTKAEICRFFGCGHNTVTRYMNELVHMECND